MRRLLLARSLAFIRRASSLQGIQNNGVARALQGHGQAASYARTSETWSWMLPGFPRTEAFSTVTLHREFSATAETLQSGVLKAEVAASEEGAKAPAEPAPRPPSATCELLGCSGRIYGYAATGLKTHCKQHRAPGMVECRKLCKFPGCGTHASFNFLGAKGNARCRTHAEEGMVQRTGITCKFPNCHVHASFNYPSAQGVSRCRKHAEEGMVQKTKRCSIPGCKTFGAYGFAHTRGGLRCSQHREESMKLLYHTRCVEPGCSRIAVYKNAGEKVGTACAVHRHPGMVRWDRTWKKKCVVEGCEAKAQYGIVTAESVVATHCTVHVQKGMANPHKRCSVPGCLRGRVYGHPGSPPQLCYVHKLPDMVPVWRESRWCSASGCTVSASFGPPGGKPQWCGRHREQGSVRLVGAVCSAIGCTVVADFGFPSDPTRRGLRCFTHREEGMVRVKQILCAERGCKKYARFASPGEMLPRLCIDHCKEGMVRVLVVKRSREEARAAADAAADAADAAAGG